MSNENAASTDTDYVALTPIHLGDVGIVCPQCFTSNCVLHVGVAVEVDLAEDPPVWATGLIVFHVCGHLHTTCECVVPLLAEISEHAEAGELLSIEDLYELQQACLPEEVSRDHDEGPPGGF